MKDYLISTIQRTFEVGLEQAECLYGELLQCTRKKHLVSYFFCFFFSFVLIVAWKLKKVLFISAYV